jgi:hypothetical protein
MYQMNKWLCDVQTKKIYYEHSDSISHVTLGNLLVIDEGSEQFIP